MFKKYRVFFSILLSICILLSYIIPTYAIATEVILGGEALLGILMITMMGARGIRMSSIGMSSEAVGDQIEDYVHNWVLRKEVNALALRAVAKGAWIQVTDTLSDLLDDLISDFISDKGISASDVGSTSSVYIDSKSYVTDIYGNTYPVYTASSTSSPYSIHFGTSFVPDLSLFCFRRDSDIALPYTHTISLLTGDSNNVVDFTMQVDRYQPSGQELIVRVNNSSFYNLSGVRNVTYFAFFAVYQNVLYLCMQSRDTYNYSIASADGRPITAQVDTSAATLQATVDKAYTYPVTTGDDVIYVNPGLGVITTETSLTDVTQRVIDGDLTSSVDISTDFPATSEVDTIEGDISAVTDLLPFLPNELEILEIPNALYDAVSDTGTNCDLVLKAGNVNIAGHSYHFWDEQTIPLTNTINQDIFLPILWAVRFLFGIALFKTIIYWVNRIVGVCMMEDNAIQSIEGRKERSNDS